MENVPVLNREQPIQLEARLFGGGGSARLRYAAQEDETIPLDSEGV